MSYTLSRTAINKLKLAEYHDTGMDMWFRPDESSGRSISEKIRGGDFIRFTDMDVAAGVEGYVMVEAVTTSFDYLHGTKLREVFESVMSVQDAKYVLFSY